MSGVHPVEIRKKGKTRTARHFPARAGGGADVPRPQNPETPHEEGNPLGERESEDFERTIDFVVLRRGDFARFSVFFPNVRE